LCAEAIDAAAQRGRQGALAQVRGQLIQRQQHLDNAWSAVGRATHSVEDVRDHPDEFGKRKTMLDQALRDLAIAREEIVRSR
jgi:hypothetical protein